MATYRLISSVTIGAGGAANIEFTSIPQTFTDLCLVYSTRSVYNNSYVTWTGFTVKANGNSANYSGKMLEGNGSSAYSQNNNVSTYWEYGASPDSGTTANTFSNGTIYIPNYASSTTYKSYSMDTVTENNATQAAQTIYAGLWSNTAAITQLTLTGAEGNFAQYSTAYLYGIKSS